MIANSKVKLFYLAFCFSSLQLFAQDDQKNDSFIEVPENFDFSNIVPRDENDFITHYNQENRLAHTYFGLVYLEETLRDIYKRYKSYEGIGANYYAGFRWPKVDGSFGFKINSETRRFEIKERNQKEENGFTFPSVQRLRRHGISLGLHEKIADSYSLNANIESLWLNETYASLVLQRSGSMHYLKGGIGLSKHWGSLSLTISYKPPVVARSENLTIRLAPEASLALEGKQESFSYLFGSSYLAYDRIYSEANPTVRILTRGIYQISNHIRAGLGLAYKPRSWQSETTASKQTMETFTVEFDIGIRHYHDSNIHFSYDNERVVFPGAERSFSYQAYIVMLNFEKTL
jgi:hypothetical protein